MAGRQQPVYEMSGEVMTSRGKEQRKRETAVNKTRSRLFRLLPRVLFADEPPLTIGLLPHAPHARPGRLQPIELHLKYK